MRRLLMFLFSLLFAGVALADSSGTLSKASSFASTLKPPVTDQSIIYLGSIFGTVGNTLMGSGGQILGQMFAVFNKGVLVAAALWLGMTTAQLAIRAASEGSFMGSNKSAHMVLLRIAMGFALILPSSTTGYSVLQDIYMKVVVAGVGLADQTWNAALNYLQYGGQLYIPPSKLSATPASTVVTAYMGTTGQLPSGYTSLTSESSSFPPLPVASQIFQDEVCMLRSGSNAWKPANGISQAYDMVLDPENGIIYFPGAGNPPGTPLSVFQNNPQAATCGYVQSYCAIGNNCAISSDQGYKGAVNMGNLPSGTSDGEMEWNYSWLAMKQLVLSILPAAENYVAQYPASQTGPDGVVTPTTYPTADPAGVVSTNSQTFMTAILAYGNLVVPLQNLLSPVSGASALRTALSGENQTPMGEVYQNQNQGWILAGAFYWDIEQANKSSSTVSVTKILPAAYPPVISNLPTTPANMGVNEMITAAADVTGGQDSNNGGNYSGYITQTTNNLAAYAGVAKDAAASNELDNQRSGGIIMQIITGIIGGLTSTLGTPFSSSQFQTIQHYNPISYLMHEGNIIIEFVAALWAGAMSITAVLMAISGLCASVSSAGMMAQTLFSWVKSVFMLLSTALLVPGLILSYYIPMYPFAVFTFAVIGWIMIVVEGMAAAPLICVGITHPEGHDFLGKAEQALMFFLGVFVRPALLVIGLIAAMLVSFVGFKILLTGFYYMSAAMPTLWAANLSEIFLWLINMIMGLIVFAGFAMEVVEQSFKLTYQLPQYVMKWIGGPEMGQDYGHMAGQLRGTMQTTGAAGTQAASSLGQATSTAAQGLKEYAAKEKAESASKLTGKTQ